MVFRVRLDLVWPDGNGWYPITPLTHCTLGPAKWGVAGIRINILPGPVVSGVNHQRVFIQAECLELVHDAADVSIEFDDRVGVLGLGHGLMNELRCWHVRLVHFHEVDVDEKRLVRFGRGV
ncbi:hypothetical protein D3C81_894420 [compost metagenome]